MAGATPGVDDIEPYAADWRAGCLAVFDGNLGRYFADDERATFIEYLDVHSSTLPYFVLVSGDTVLACGGYGKEGDRVSLNWGMVARDHHRRGLGQCITRFRLERIAVEHPDTPVRIETSQHTMGFYARLGFAVENHTPDGFGVGIDRVVMVWLPAAPEPGA
ncbi:MAG: GNAT family N-acetyltransferase [Pseudomonadota bacterium]